MRIYSSYFANHRNHPDWIVPVSIARYAPRYFRGKRFLTLAPDKLALTWAWSDFRAAYLGKLDKLDPKVVLKQLEELSGGKDIILIGYGKSADGDTRGLIAEWLFETTGTLVMELETDEPCDGMGLQIILEF